jgi:hypothetical protein
LLDRGHVVFFTAPLTWITPYLFLLAVLATIGFEFALLRSRVTDIEKDLGRLRAPSWAHWLERHNLQRHLAYARVWLRANPQDRAKAERYLSRVVTRLQRATT